MRNVRLLDKEAVFLGIDEGEEGLWLQTYRYRSPIYIPFTCLEKLDFTAKKIVLSYKQAFIYQKRIATGDPIPKLQKFTLI